jgi:hypothetical protein
MTPEDAGIAGIPYIVLDGGQSYRIGPYILESHTWSFVQPERNGRPYEGQIKDSDEFFFLKGHVLVDFDHDLMVFLHPYRQGQVPPSVYDEFAEMRDLLPRWTRTRWLGVECIKGSLLNGLLNFKLYDYRADKPVSRTCRGIKRLNRLLDGHFDECKFYGTAEAFKQLGMDVC